ncbi:MAG: NAD-dependent DNA ligase LigA, partial [Anaerovorax sp.]
MEKTTENFQKMKELVDVLNRAGKSYEIDNLEVMSNRKYDQLYDELLSLESQIGITMSNSPTNTVGYEVVSSLPKEKHSSPMLSLDKTKEMDTLKSWLGGQKGLLSWKLDGLTIVLTYEGGKLVKGVTRGNGQTGEVITNNAKVFENIPLIIPYEGKLVVRGEAVINYSDFEKINGQIEDAGAKYKNPRNLCSGTVRQLNNQITAERKVHFFAFSLVEMDDLEKMQVHHSRTEELQWLTDHHFQVVEHATVCEENLEQVVEEWKEKAGHTDFPSDGLVLVYDDVAYGKSLGATAKFPRDAIAFKWKDEVAVTTLREIQWNPSRTGLINPIAVFEPVELEGTTVSRAGLHNISILEELALQVGDRVGVYKANMIIPQIAENFSAQERKVQVSNTDPESGRFLLCPHCPVCGTETVIKQDEEGKGNGVKTLVCPNPTCLAKQVKSFTHFVSRDAMNMEGLSEATIEKLIGKGLVKELADLFHVEKFGETIKEMEGFGEKS